jgi:hypothetical protein
MGRQTRFACRLDYDSFSVITSANRLKNFGAEKERTPPKTSARK